MIKHSEEFKQEALRITTATCCQPHSFRRQAIPACRRLWRLLMICWAEIRRMRSTFSTTLAANIPAIPDRVPTVKNRHSFKICYQP